MTRQLGDEDPSNHGAQRDESPTAEPRNGSNNAGGHRYEVGPGFEIAVRSETPSAVQLTIKKDDEGGRDPSKATGSVHGHEEIEKRLDAVERALVAMVHQLKRIEARLPK